MRPDFSFQDECIDKIWSTVFGRRVERVLATAPTGAGKGVMIGELFAREIRSGGRPIVYTNRRTIRHQISEHLKKAGIRHGQRAAGHKPDFDAAAQVSSLPTELARSMNKYHPWELYDATLAIIDEAHSNKSTTAQAVIAHHLKSDCPVIGFTATPVGLGSLYDELLLLIRNSELRRRGVIVPCDVFAPSEMDMDGIDLSADGDYVQSQVQERFAEIKHAVIGNVLQSLLELNPQLKPTMLFAPGVPESRWFAEHLTAKGVPTEHVDAETREGDRLRIFERVRSGETKVLSSYDVIREGFDLPAVEHMVVCRPTRSVTVYVQMIGRGLRASPGKERACMQDHCGLWHQPGLGSPNQDRDWKLTDTNKSIAKAEKKDRLERKPGEEREPVCCPSCKRVMACKPDHNYRCPCGHVFKKSVRMVLQLDGQLERKVGSVTKRQNPKDDTYFYRSGIYAAARSGRTVGQAYGIACSKKGGPISRSECQIWIPERDDEQWYRLASEVYPWAAGKRVPKSGKIV